MENKGATVIYKEKFTGIKTDRPQLNELLSKLKEGDKLVVTKLDRLARNTKEGIEIIEKLFAKGVKVHVLNVGFLENTTMGRFFVQTLLAVAEMERNLIIERTQEGKAIAKQQPGFCEGRPKLCREHKFRYGYRKITALLRQEIRVNHKVVQRIKQKYGWQCRMKMKKHKQTRQPYYFAANLLNRNFEATAPLQKLVIDITYLPFGQKQLYLSSIQDLYNGEIIAYSIGDCQDTDFVLNTLPQLDNLPEGCTPHSDQGSVYTSYRYQQAVKGKGIIMSMSRKGMPADNAPINRFIQH